MAIRILSSESISGNITIHSPSNAPYIDFVENADTGDSKARITMDQIDTNNGTLIFATENAGTLTTALTISQSQNATFAGDVHAGGRLRSDVGSDSGTQLNLWADSNGSTFLAGYNFARYTGINNARTQTFVIDHLKAATFAGNQVTVDPASGDAILQLQSSTQILRIDQNSIRTGTNNNLALFTNGNSNQLVLKHSNGYVGIGTSSPSQKLHVVGKGLFTDDIQLTQTNPRIDYGNSTAGALRFWSVDENSEKMRITSSGNVGIGATSPQANLHINEDTSNSYGILRLEGANRGGIIEMYNQTSYPVSSWTTDQSGNIFFATSGAFAATSLSTKFTILTGGNVGIGTTSPSATEPTGGRLPTGWTRANSRALEIAAPDFANSGLFLRNSGTTATGTDITGDQYFGDTYIDNRFNSDNGSIYFRTKTAVSPQIRMAIKGNGNVGIGVESPDAKLHINGFTAGQGVRIQYGNSSGTIQAVNFIANGGNNGVIGMQMVSAGVGDLWLGGSGGRSLTLYRDGNVGIGVESPDAKLQVNGSISSGTGTAPTQIIYDSNGNVRAFTHNFSEEKSTPSARSVTFVDVSGVGNFHQAFFYVQYGTRLQGVSDATTGVVIRTYGVNRFNGGTLQVTETNAIAGSSNSLAHALVSVAIVSNTQYRLIINFSSTLGASSFASGEIKGYGVGDTFPTITFAEGAAG